MGLPDRRDGDDLEVENVNFADRVVAGERVVTGLPNVTQIATIC